MAGVISLEFESPSDNYLSHLILRLRVVLRALMPHARNYLVLRAAFPLRGKYPVLRAAIPLTGNYQHQSVQSLGGVYAL